MGYAENITKEDIQIFNLKCRVFFVILKWYVIALKKSDHAKQMYETLKIIRIDKLWPGMFDI